MNLEPGSRRGPILGGRWVQGTGFSLLPRGGLALSLLNVMMGQTADNAVQKVLGEVRGIADNKRGGRDAQGEHTKPVGLLSYKPAHPSVSPAGSCGRYKTLDPWHERDRRYHFSRRHQARHQVLHSPAGEHHARSSHHEGEHSNPRDQVGNVDSLRFSM